MANVDVTDIVNDPDLTDSFKVVRSVEVVDDNGRAQMQPQTYPVFGVVQPASGRTLELMPEATRTSENIEIWTTFGIQEASDQTAADEIIWKNRHYVVTHVDPFDNWGAGYVHVVCTRKELLPESTPI
jgi:hypothetical protein